MPGTWLTCWRSCPIALMVPAVLGLMHMLRERQVALGHVGGGLAMLGLLAFTGLVAMELVLWQMAGAGNTAETVALLERLNETAGIVIPFVLLSFGFSLGLATLAVGLYRARAVQSWMATFVAVGAVLFGFAIATAMNWLAIVAAAFLVVGLGAIGRWSFARPTKPGSTPRSTTASARPGDALSPRRGGPAAPG